AQAQPRTALVPPPRRHVAGTRDTRRVNSSPSRRSRPCATAADASAASHREVSATSISRFGASAAPRDNGRTNRAQQITSTEALTNSSSASTECDGCLTTRCERDSLLCALEEKNDHDG